MIRPPAMPITIPRRLQRNLILAAIIVIGTVVTQVGGVIVAGSWWFFRYRYFVKSAHPRRYALLATAGAYLAATVIVVPALAYPFGRTPLPWVASAETPLAPRSLLFCLLNRHYVRADLRKASIRTAQEFGKSSPGSVIYYLDANFPFIDGFPLFPHLSHMDGRKIDFTLCYRRKSDPSQHALSPSPLGYFIYENPRAGEPKPYAGKFCPMRWDLPFLQGLNRGREFDPERTRRFVQILLRQPETDKVLLEIHLQRRLGLSSSKLRFQQCNAARHDDHVHYQVSR